MRPYVKICGITDAQDATAATDLGADFLGLNFYEPSPRYVDPHKARRIAEAVRERCSDPPELIGVFVNPSRAHVADIVETVDLDRVQFHGEESRADVELWAERALQVVRVKERLDAGSLTGWQHVWGVLVDVAHPDLWGGSGESWDFASLRGVRGLPARVFIAGGLGPGNVRRIVRTARPWGIDLCSGVEARPGKKDHELMARLFEELAPREEIEDGESHSQSISAA